MISNSNRTATGFVKHVVSVLCRPMSWVYGMILLIATTNVSLAYQNVTLPQAKDVKAIPYATGFEKADGITFGESNVLFAANYRGNGNIGKISADMTASLFCKISELAKLEGSKPRIAGLKIDLSERLIVADAGAGRLLRISKDGKKAEVLADRYMGTRFRSVSDVALDIDGNVYFTDSGAEEGRKKAIGAVYRYSIETRTISLIAKDLAYPTGIAVYHSENKESKQASKLIVAESLAYQLIAFDIVDPAKVGKPKTVFKFPEKTMGSIKGGAFEPRGIVFDAEQRLYLTMKGSGFVNVINGVHLKDPKIIRQFDAGGNDVCNCHFNSGYLYTSIESKEAVFRLKLNISGYSYSQNPDKKD